MGKAHTGAILCLQVWIMECYLAWVGDNVSLHSVTVLLLCLSLHKLLFPSFVCTPAVNCAVRGLAPVTLMCMASTPPPVFVSEAEFGPEHITPPLKK